MKLPAFILSGFLGSGKTTLLLRLLHEATIRGLRPGIMMNELGRQDVDGRIIGEYAQFPVERLLDGCVCCNKREELADSLRLLLRQRPDVIFIELTGVANPEEITEVIKEQFGNEIGASRVVTLLDAENVLEYNSIFSTDRRLVRTLRRQIEVADVIVVNKTDLVAPNKLNKIKKVIAKQNVAADIICTVHSQIDLDLVLAGIRPGESPPAAAQAFRVIQGIPATEGEAHSHSAGADGKSFSKVNTITLSMPEETGIEIDRLERFLRHNEQQIIRAKGYVKLESGLQLIQYAGNRITREASSYPGKPYLVVIGLELNERRLLDDWAALFDRNVLNRESRSH